MNAGRWANMTEAARSVNKMVGEENSKKWGCWNISSLIIWVVFLAGIIGGIGMALFDKPSKPTKTPQIQKKVSPNPK